MADIVPNIQNRQKKWISAWLRIQSCVSGMQETPFWNQFSLWLTDQSLTCYFTKRTFSSAHSELHRLGPKQWRRNMRISMWPKCNHSTHHRKRNIAKFQGFLSFFAVAAVSGSFFTTGFSWKLPAVVEVEGKCPFTELEAEWTCRLELELVGGWTIELPGCLVSVADLWSDGRSTSVTVAVRAISRVTLFQ